MKSNKIKKYLQLIKYTYTNQFVYLYSDGHIELQKNTVTQNKNKKVE